MRSSKNSFVVPLVGDGKCVKCTTTSDDDEYGDEEIEDRNGKEKDYSDIDLVRYLEQTGSIIALSRLLDRLDDLTSGRDAEVDAEFDNFDHTTNSLDHLERAYSPR